MLGSVPRSGPGPRMTQGGAESPAETLDGVRGLSLCSLCLLLPGPGDVRKEVQTGQGFQDWDILMKEGKHGAGGVHGGQVVLSGF